VPSAPGPFSTDSPGRALPSSGWCAGAVLDADGNRTRKTTLDWIEDYGYDDIHRLVSADRSAGTPTRWRFAYDPVGNRKGDQTDDAAVGASFNKLN
jgi:YD repeat-containing protein